MKNKDILFSFKLKRTMSRDKHFNEILKWKTLMRNLKKCANPLNSVPNKPALNSSKENLLRCGGGEIRTRGILADTTALQAIALGHYATPPIIFFASFHTFLSDLYVNLFSTSSIGSHSTFSISKSCSFMSPDSYSIKK